MRLVMPGWSRFRRSLARPVSDGSEQALRTGGSAHEFTATRTRARATHTHIHTHTHTHTLGRCSEYHAGGSLEELYRHNAGSGGGAGRRKDIPRQQVPVYYLSAFVFACVRVLAATSQRPCVCDIPQQQVPVSDLSACVCVRARYEINQKAECLQADVQEH
jgi:hypothetical protein